MEVTICKGCGVSGLLAFGYCHDCREFQNREYNQKIYASEVLQDLKDWIGSEDRPEDIIVHIDKKIAKLIE